ncbi:MAG: hypothetical protein HY904_12890 [Deltaproteobacteria bacterium]|nr:hypothetical protein [Deltaproteobacteria bacterium]
MSTFTAGCTLAWTLLLAPQGGRPPPPPPPPPPAAEPAPAPAAKPAPAAAPGKPAATQPAEGEKKEAAKPESKPAPKKVSPEQAFETGVKAFNTGGYGKAAENFYVYLTTQEPNAPFYDWSEYYLGRSLRAAGMAHAGDEYLYNVAKARARPDLVPDALRGLEEDIRHGAYDEELLVRDLIAGSEFGDVPNDVKAFVQYWQGMVDLRDGREDWALLHFHKIPEGTRYTAMATHVMAVQALTKGKVDEAGEMFASILKDPHADLETVNEAHRSLARVLFEKKDYLGALKKYDDVKVPFLSEEEASIFLEKAWARYYLKDHRGALAILLSLDAPSYRRTYFPERWILEALIYKSLCHYAASKASAREFTRRYGDALKALRDQRTPLAHPTIRNAALQSPVAGRRLRQLKRLTTERDRLLDFKTSDVLKKHLLRVYDLKVKETGRLLEEDLEREARRVADELLDIEEQARLVDYEVGLEVFRRVPQAARRTRIPERDKPAPFGSREVHYLFDGEYWNDELHDYQVSIEDRCFAEGLFK